MERGSGTPQRLQRSSWVATRAGLVYMVETGINTGINIGVKYQTSLV
jgi:hypothetical protein